MPAAVVLRAVAAVLVVAVPLAQAVVLAVFDMLVAVLEAQNSLVAAQVVLALEWRGHLKAYLDLSLYLAHDTHCDQSP